MGGKRDGELALLGCLLAIAAASVIAVTLVTVTVIVAAAIAANAAFTTVAALAG